MINNNKKRVMMWEIWKRQLNEVKLKKETKRKELRWRKKEFGEENVFPNFKLQKELKKSEEKTKKLCFFVFQWKNTFFYDFITIRMCYI